MSREPKTPSRTMAPLPAYLLCSAVAPKMTCHERMKTPAPRNGGSACVHTDKRRGVLPPRCLAATVASLLALIAPAALAFGLGEMAVTSRLGEPLRAVVPLIGRQTGTPDADCIKLVPPPSGSAGTPWLAKADLRIERRRGALRLRISTAESVTHPALMVGLQATCGTELTREYALLLAPPEISSRSAGSPSATEGTDPPLRDTRRIPMRESAEAAKSRNVWHVPSPARQGEHDRGGATAPTESGVAPSSRGEPPNRNGDRIERALEQGEAVLRTAAEDQAAAEARVAEQIRRMEETLAALQQKMNAADSAMPDPLAAPATESANKPAEPVERTVQTAAALPKAAEGAATMSEAPAWLLILLAAPAAGALPILWRRRRAQRDEGQDDAESPLPASGRPAITVDFPISLDEPLPEQAESPRGMARNAPQDLADEHHIDVTEHESTLELAEIMLSFGRVQGAAQTLADYIDANPKQAVRPWLRLLEVYRDADMRQEFEALACRLNKTFNIAVMAWEQKPRRRETESLEKYPHIVSRLVETWNTPECLEYLRHLIHDNRSGTRSGFSAGEIQEILLLVAILEENLAGHADSSPATAEPASPRAINAEAQAAPDATPSPRPLMHLLASQSHRVPKHPHVPNVVG